MIDFDNLLSAFAGMIEDGIGGAGPQRITLGKVSEAEALNHVFIQLPLTGKLSASGIDDIAYTFTDIDSWDYKPVYRLIDVCIAARDRVTTEFLRYLAEHESQAKNPGERRIRNPC